MVVSPNKAETVHPEQPVLVASPSPLPTVVDEISNSIGKRENVEEAGVTTPAAGSELVPTGEIVLKNETTVATPAETVKEEASNSTSVTETSTSATETSPSVTETTASTPISTPSVDATPVEGKQESCDTVGPDPSIPAPARTSSDAAPVEGSSGWKRVTLTSYQKSQM